MYAAVELGAALKESAFGSCSLSDGWPTPPYNVHPHVIPPTQLLLTHVPLGFCGKRHILISKSGTIPYLTLENDTIFTAGEVVEVRKWLQS